MEHILRGEMLRHPCTFVDDLIVQAREETDPAIRIELYRQIEEAFFSVIKVNSPSRRCGCEQNISPNTPGSDALQFSSAGSSGTTG